MVAINLVAAEKSEKETSPALAQPKIDVIVSKTEQQPRQEVVIENENYQAHSFPFYLTLLVTLQICTLLLLEGLIHPPTNDKQWRQLASLISYWTGILFVQFLLGCYLEVTYGWIRTATILATGWIVCTFNTDFTLSDSDLWSGASGGAFALFGAHFAIVLMNLDAMDFNTANRRLFLLILGFLAFDVHLYRSANYFKPAEAIREDGAIIGLLVGYFLFRIPEETKQQKFVHLRLIASAVFVTLVSMLSILVAQIAR